MLGIAALVAVLDGTVVAVALGPLAADLGAPLSTVVWVTIAYLLAAATMLPLLGWASSRFGGRAVFLTGLALFVLGSGLAAMAWSAPTLIAFRVLQGFGGGLLEPTSLALAARLASKDRVGRVLGTMSMIINVAPVLGPVTGALLLDTGHWQWIFGINIPLGLVVFLAAMAVIPSDRTDRAGAARPTADVRGLTLLTSGYVGMLLALNQSGQHRSGWFVGLSAALGAVLLAGYVWHALTITGPPALDLRLLRRREFAAALAVMGMVGLIMYSLLTSLPIVGASRYRLHGFDRGLLVCALGLGLLVSMSSAGRISDRTGPRPLVRAGSIATAAGLSALALGQARLALGALFILLVFVGLSFGCTAAPAFASIYRTLPAVDQPQGTTALFMAVQLSASLGVSVLGLLQARDGPNWFGMLCALLAVAAIAMAALSYALPGRPEQ